VAKARFVSCPRCGAQVAWSPENPYRPFCSERCKLIELGDWAMEKYRAAVEEDKDPPEANRTEDS
jgi:endogenous inhibitor of DNA gyrase (YacG/DUF329 family)